MQEKTTRLEYDFLGSLEVASDAYYGIQTKRAAENFPITGYRMHPELIRALALVKKAAARANMACGTLDASCGQAIVKAAEEIIDGRLHEQFLVDPIQGGAGTSANMNANEVIANRALEICGLRKGDYSRISPNNHVNQSQSTNDVFPTATRLAAITLTRRLLQVMRQMCQEFANKAKAFDDVLKIGRTHLQDAVPIRLGQEFAAYQAVFSRDIARIQRSLQSLYAINMGATAIGTGLNASPDYRIEVKNFLIQDTGFPLSLSADLVDATQNTDAYTELSAALKICMINMSKIANDLRLMASGPRAGLNEIMLPPRQPGSSIMPGKINPVMAEVINQTAFQVIGNDQTISLASEAGQFELNVMEPVLVFNLLQSLTIMANAFQTFTKHCLAGITVNRERLEAFVRGNIGIVTALVPVIGYEKASEIAKEALREGHSVRDIVKRRRLITDKLLDHLLDPHHMTEPKKKE
ncbi:aspartate ammonia-lyase [Sporolactobacillus spathodeae]|uniref:Aspartate ammonia-lyase n=1 Tax=Sporolactobacillus spathodeae TaxID=1465502 RepID=A0ABS2QBJ6_9BACL|nr:aspartate ammonia-lyase [Sporolactobacillus spathodeae]MBM7658332.1 aspartate ammonia-lyase [Sporolactobacillus spathodeae]